MSIADLILDPALYRDCISRWRRSLGAWAVGTYRQDDTVDVRYDPDGPIRPSLPINVVDDLDTD
jgi:hypothetical protein